MDVRLLLHGTLLAVLTVLLSACESQPRELTLSQEESFDGLRRVKNSVAHKVWIREGLDLSGYDALMLEGAGIKYRPVEAASTTRARSSRREFPVPEQNQERLRRMAEEEFTRELGNSQRFSLTDRPGPNVLRVEGALIDVVSFVPPDPVGRGDIILSRIGEATLVIQVSDSQSRAVLARMVDRRAADPVVAQRSSTPFNQSEVRRLLRRWATQLREGLDNLADNPPG